MRTQIGAQDPDDKDNYEDTLNELYLSKLQQMLEYANEGQPSGGMPRCVVSVSLFDRRLPKYPVVFSRPLPISRYNW